ncbi:MAG: DNA polymerase IV [Euryarchaeota archaeon]|nr:DNA polymerase IV [Euryarchaeota archaeon]
MHTPYKNRIILHVDMDSFFASVEVRERPKLRGKPVVVGADPKGGAGRGVVSTCSYEAREYGVRSGMPISQAFQLCPQAAFLPVNLTLYHEVSAHVMEIMGRYAEKIQQVSVDEAYLDISSAGSFEAAEAIAREIMDEIREGEYITCSVGIAPNKVVAKIASDFKKPEGLTVVTPGEVQAFLDPMPVTKIPGIGKKTKERLRSIGISTISDLAAADIQELISIFGKSGIRMHELACGTDEGEVEDRGERKSIAREVTFLKDTSDRDLIFKTGESLAEDDCMRLSERGFCCRTVTVKIRYTGFVTKTKAQTLEHFTDDPAVIRRCAARLLSEVLEEKSVRLIGVKLSNFESGETRQATIDEFGE